MTTLQKTLALAIVVVILLHFVGDSDLRQRNYEVMPEMFFSIPYGAFDPNPNFADGKTAHPPVPGTIAQGHAPLAAEGVLLDTTREWKDLPGGQQAAWNAFEAPEPAETDLARGREVFSVICITCHGPGGAGDGKVTKRGVPPPPSLAGDGAKAMSDGRLFRIITAGQGNMAPHAVQVSRDNRWRVIRFVRSLQGN